jgi:hypothetical protein
VTEKREVPLWVVAIICGTVSLLWSRAAEAWDLTFWHAVIVAAPLYAWGLVGHLRDKRKARSHTGLSGDSELTRRP